MPGQKIRVAEIQAIHRPYHQAKSGDFIGVLRNPPIFTEGPKNIF
jgi:hypothetical protein